MNIITETSIDMLIKDSVSVKTERYVVEGSTKEPLGLPHRRAYVNSVEGRVELEEIGEPYLGAILAIWGDEPTVFPEEEEEEEEEEGTIIEEEIIDEDN